MTHFDFEADEIRDEWLEERTYASPSYRPHYNASAYAIAGKGKGATSHIPEGVTPPTLA